MRLSIVVATLGVTATAATASPLYLATPNLGTELGPRIVMARIGEAFDQLMPRATIETLVRWQASLRDTLYGAVDRFSSFAEHGGIHIPNLTPLVVEPVTAALDTEESSGFGWRDDPFRHRARYHAGADYRGKRGTPIVASGDGIVVFAGRRGGYGYMIEVDHGGGLTTRYAHLQKILIDDDAVVTAGQPIGRLGSSGRATGPHLHFEVRLDGRPVDPMTALTIAQLEREDPALGQIAAFALSPELQSEVSSDIDPPKQPPKKKETRPDRPGRVRVAKPVS
jgi:murein DD-endopeptidase MepM/ murein hydrolase activator NlpD